MQIPTKLKLSIMRGYEYPQQGMFASRIEGGFSRSWIPALELPALVVH